MAYSGFEKGGIWRVQRGPRKRPQTTPPLEVYSVTQNSVRNAQKHILFTKMKIFWEWRTTPSQDFFSEWGGTPLPTFHGHPKYPLYV